tara:strand:+ start:2015 stop:2920 length:906 start_codon:yes stop_codon:yes gene_type:complete
MNKHEYQFDEVVIGNSLAALTYSYLNSVPLIYNGDSKPQFFDFFDSEFELDKLHLETMNYELNGIESTKTVGHSKLKVWEHLMFVLSLSGHIPFSNKVSTIRIEDDNVLKVTTKKFRVIRAKFKKLRIFDSENMDGLPAPEKQILSFKVIDWVDVKSGMKHSYDYFETDSEFVKEVYFYPSTRFAGSIDRKDLVSVSYLKKYQLENFENSDTYVKFKILKLMKAAGIRGARNGKDFNNPEKYKYYAVKIEPRKREVLKSQRDIYENTETLNFDYRPEEKIYIDSKKKNEYNVKLNELIVRK